MNLYLASDHGGFYLKEHLINHLVQKNIAFQNLGVKSEEKSDYPDIAKLLVEEVLKDKTNRGILICGTGLGVTIAANRFSGIRACLCHDLHTAEMSRKHNNSNLLTLGGRVLKEKIAIDILETWLYTEFEGGRHLGRINKLK